MNLIHGISTLIKRVEHSASIPLVKCDQKPFEECPSPEEVERQPVTIGEGNLSFEFFVTYLETDSVKKRVDRSAYPRRLDLFTMVNHQSEVSTNLPVKEAQACT